MGPGEGELPLGSRRREAAIELRVGTQAIPLPAAVAGRLESLGFPDGLCGNGASVLCSDAAQSAVARSGARHGARILVVVPDRTRELSLPWFLSKLGEALGEVGVDAPDVRLAIASGTHAATPDDASPERLGEWGRRAQIIAFRPEDATADVGTTPAGTNVRVLPALLESDVVIAVGGSAFHWFAGFGGGPKLLFPGLGARESIAANHRRALGPWPPGGLAPGVEPGRLDGNPVAEDLAAAANLLPAATHLTDFGGNAPRVWQSRAEFLELTSSFARWRRTGSGRSFDVVVASAGGRPRDVDAIQSHKALYHAALYAKDGAHILLAADCPEGAGSAPFARWLAVPGRDAREEQARAAYDLNAQTAISLAAIAARCRVTWIGDGTPPVLDDLGISRVPVRESVDVIRRALDDAGPDARAAFLPAATDVIPSEAA